MDEAASYGFAHFPLRVLWSTVLEPNPPLYYSIQKISLFFGSSEALLRLVPAVIGTASVPLIYLLARLFNSSSTGLIAAALLATSPVHIQYSQEARGYVLLMAASIVVVWAIATVYQLEEPSRRLSRSANSRVWGAYVFGLLVALYTHNTAAILWLVANIMLFARWFVEPKGSMQVLRFWIGANALVLAGWSWWLPAVIGQSVHALNDFWIWRPTAMQAIGMTEAVYGQMWLLEGQPLVTPAFIAIGFLGVYCLWKRSPWWAILAAGFVLLPPVLTYSISYIRPIMLVRTLLWPLPIFIVLVGLAVDSIRPRWLVLPAMTLLIAIQGAGLINYYSSSAKAEPWDEIVTHIQRGSALSDSVVLFCAPDGIIPFSYYASRFGFSRREYAISDSTEPSWRRMLVHALAPALASVAPNQLSEIVSQYEQVWLVERSCDLSDLVRSALTNVKPISTSHSFSHIEISLFTNRPEPAT